ncbi:hypothetical protein ACOME3_008207 [Neoechinorhynchus agilis]
MAENYRTMPVRLKPSKPFIDCEASFYQRKAQSVFYNRTYKRLFQYLEDLKKAIKKKHRGRYLREIPIPANNCQVFGQDIVLMKYSTENMFNHFKEYVYELKERIRDMEMEKITEVRFQKDGESACYENYFLSTRARIMRPIVDAAMAHVFTDVVRMYGVHPTNKFWEIPPKKISSALYPHKLFLKYWSVFS